MYAKVFTLFVFVQVLGFALQAQDRFSVNAGRITVVSGSEPFILSLYGITYDRRPELQICHDRRNV
ncbi:hypothetical protein [Sphingobacterium athyrii]|uniref:hypothetical protein n=1 Tax=Sphingobacterium athyrii TaxID=2152717 RepID=UPI0011B2063B|nr:hypothetical protein [Sphingobacterium athyrii]